jgi:hypothetical protein
MGHTLNRPQISTINLQTEIDHAHHQQLLWHPDQECLASKLGKVSKQIGTPSHSAIEMKACHGTRCHSRSSLAALGLAGRVF